MSTTDILVSIKNYALRIYAEKNKNEDIVWNRNVKLPLTHLTNIKGNEAVAPKIFF